jgi:hypothetical protein
VVVKMANSTVKESKPDADDEVEFEVNHDQKKPGFVPTITTKLTATKGFLWNPVTKEVIGRTWDSWGKYWAVEPIHPILPNFCT